MKTLLLAALLLTGTAVAHAEDIAASASSETTSGFVTRYTLDTFQIAPSSVRLGGRADVVSGTIDVDTEHRELRLTLRRHLNCPRGVMCIQMLEAPVVISLPIQQDEKDSCGVTTIVAERNLLVADGELTRVEVTDPNGADVCAGNADDITFVHRAKVTVTESGLGQRLPAVSEMSGFPTR